jgi:hypothetical protein
MEEGNINFFLSENEKIESSIVSESDIDLSQFINDNDIHHTYDIEQLELYYKNYNVKSLIQILQYYKIYKQKMVKDELIQVLLFFETEPNNHDIVFRRVRLWQNIQELKDDPYFSKYIMF